MNAQKAEFTDTDMAGTAKRLDQIGWGIFLVMIGGMLREQNQLLRKQLHAA